MLVEALPYIQKFYGKTVVVKYGGNAMISEELRQRRHERHRPARSLVGIQVVVVHGGGPEIDEMLQEDRQGVQICGRPALHRRGDHGRGPAGALRQGQQEPGGHASTACGGKAIGLCGLDGGLFQAEQLDEQDTAWWARSPRSNPAAGPRRAGKRLHPGGLHRGPGHGRATPPTTSTPTPPPPSLPRPSVRKSSSC